MTAVSYPAALATHVERDPDHVAIVHEGEAITRRELDDESARWAHAYLEAGAEMGDLVAIALPNGIPFFCAVIAAWKVGATPLPLSTRLPEAELEAILAIAQPPLLVRVPVHVDEQPTDPLPDVVSPSWKAMATGGSTGTPKVVLDTEPASADPLAPENMMRVDGVQLVAGPLYHSGPFINAVWGLLSGATLVVMSRFDPEEVLRLVERHRVDWAILVPTMQHRIWNLGEEVRGRYDVSSLRAVMSSGGPYPAWLKEHMMDWLGEDAIYEAYGGTELLGGTVIAGPEARRHPGSVGRVKSGFEMQVTDDDFVELPPGEVGHVWFRRVDGGGETYAYVGAESRARDGWDTFGDVGWVDEEGYLYLADRRTDMIVSGAVNVYPAEVEAAVESYPGVRSAAVIGLPDADLGQRVHAIVDAPDGVELDALAEHVADRVARPKLPRSYELVDEPLRDDAGKLRRAALREARLP